VASRADPEAISAFSARTMERGVCGAALPTDARPAGWDFRFFSRGRFRAPFGAECSSNRPGTIFLSPGHHERERILYFRENLRMLTMRRACGCKSLPA